jgi:hypothetical protein
MFFKMKRELITRILLCLSLMADNGVSVSNSGQSYNYPSHSGQD